MRGGHAALEKSFFLFTFSDYSFLVSESQKSHAETKGAGHKEGVVLDTSRAASAVITRGGGEKWGAEGCWPVKLGGVMGLGGHKSVTALRPLCCDREDRSECEGVGNCSGNGWILVCIETSVVVYCFCSYLSVVTSTQLFLYVC